MQDFFNTCWPIFKFVLMCGLPVLALMLTIDLFFTNLENEQDEQDN